MLVCIYKRMPSGMREAGWFITVASFCILHLQCHIGGDQGETVVIIGISKACSPLFYYTIASGGLQRWGKKYGDSEKSGCVIIIAAYTLHCLLCGLCCSDQREGECLVFGARMTMQCIIGHV